jgi:hypothetical protein
VPTSGHEANGAAEANEVNGAAEANGHGLLDLSGLSLDDLSALEDSVVADVLRDLVQRRRCGSESGQRYNQFNSSI